MTNLLIPLAHLLLLAERYVDAHPGESYGEAFLDALGNFPGSIVIFIVCLGVAGFVIKLLIYHLKIISKSETTYANLKKHYKDRLNPDKVSCCKSFKRIFIQKKPQKRYSLSEEWQVKPQESNHKLSILSRKQVLKDLGKLELLMPKLTEEQEKSFIEEKEQVLRTNQENSLINKSRFNSETVDFMKPEQT